ncbi:hypothetical protein H632_c957p0 [Helicosporidium sp. ATCC 50920]|nr:hypothetical protein H632_c957p0 [Helicosporidium sp. ATCC 50920]|eukprot:KDD74968.1 hypothetical protein H632_c957p0 [Helicosporidium sp. ATCC 50920]
MQSPTASAFSSPLAGGLTLDGSQLPAGQYIYSAPSSASSSLAAGSATTSLERSLLALNLGSYAGLPAEYSPVDRASWGDAPPLQAGSDWHHQAAAAYPLTAPALAHHLHHQEGFAPGAALDVVSQRLRRALMNRPTGDGPSGASKEPTVKLWLGGIDGTATLETVQTIFSQYGPVVDKELQPARHERGRTDQWGFVVFKNVDDSKRAYDALIGEVIPELTGTRRLKLQYRHPDMRRMR